MRIDLRPNKTPDNVLAFEVVADGALIGTYRTRNEAIEAFGAYLRSLHEVAPRLEYHAPPESQRDTPRSGSLCRTCGRMIVGTLCLDCLGT